MKLMYVLNISNISNGKTSLPVQLELGDFTLGFCNEVNVQLYIFSSVLFEVL